MQSLGLELWSSDGVPTESGPAKGALVVDTTNGNLYINVGTASVASWSLISALGATITPAEIAPYENITATSDGTGTGALSGNAFHAIVTSSGATQQVSLPASSDALIGKSFTIWVGSNGFEMITPASSNATINNVDSDGTNQADIPANTMSRVTLAAANKWLLENLTQLGAVTTAIIPDND